MGSVLPITSPAFLASSVVEFGRLVDRTSQRAAELSSGRRTLNNGVDSATLTTVQGLRLQVVELEQSSKNVAFNDSLASVAAGDLNNIKTQLTAVAALAAAASNATISNEDRAFSQQKLNELLQVIDTIAADSKFNNLNLLDGTFTAVQIRVGAETTDIITLSLPDSDSNALFSGTLPDISNQADASTAVTQIATAIATIDTALGDIEGVKGRLARAEDNIRTTLTGVNNASGALENIDPQADILKFSLEQIQVNIASSVIAQTQKLSSDLLGVLNFNIARNENTGQERPDEALNLARNSLQSSATENVKTVIQAP